MRALSLTRPWTTLVLHHGKLIENRTWSTSYRGPLVVHGAKSYDTAAVAYAASLVDDEQWTALLPYGQAAHPTGLLGIVDLVSVCTGFPCSCGPWAMPGQCHWRLRDPRPFPEPVPHGGRLGLWTVDDALLPDGGT